MGPHPLTPKQWLLLLILWMRTIHSLFTRSSISAYSTPVNEIINHSGLVLTPLRTYKEGTHDTCLDLGSVPESLAHSSKTFTQWTCGPGLLRINWNQLSPLRLSLSPQHRELRVVAWGESLKEPLGDETAASAEIGMGADELDNYRI